MLHQLLLFQGVDTTYPYSEIINVSKAEKVNVWTTSSPQTLCYAASYLVEKGCPLDKKTSWGYLEQDRLRMANCSIPSIPKECRKSLTFVDMMKILLCPFEPGKNALLARNPKLLTDREKLLALCGSVRGVITSKEASKELGHYLFVDVVGVVMSYVGRVTTSSLEEEELLKLDMLMC
jgi:hypothetical protein